MGRKSQCERKTQHINCRNLSDCQRGYIEEQANIASIRRGYTVSQSKIIAEMVSESMKKQNFSCE